MGVFTDKRYIQLLLFVIFVSRVPIYGPFSSMTFLSGSLKKCVNIGLLKVNRNSILKGHNKIILMISLIHK